jgi:hypothetical protein
MTNMSYNVYPLKEEIRKRKFGSGRPFKLDTRDKFLMLLVYYRLYITYTLAEFLFDLDQGNGCRDIQKTESLIRQCVPIPEKIYRITKRLQRPEEIEQYFPGVLSFTDSTEQQIPRPADNKGKTMFYLGKKKRHTVSTQIMVNNKGIIIHKLGHKKGRIHDYDIYKKNHSVNPNQVVNVYDFRYLGVEKTFKNKHHHCLAEGGKIESFPEEREYNKSHSRKRIVIEHTICRLKKYKIMSDVFRNRLRKYNRMSDIVSCLVTYRIMNH